MPAFLLLLSLFLSAPAHAEVGEDLSAREVKPLLELGLGGGAGTFPHYPASDQAQFKWIVVPTFRYRGNVLRADEEDGPRARLLAGPNYGIEVSGLGSLPASSDKNDARKGMPDLDLLGEIGPQGYWKAQRNEHLETRIVLALRAAGSTNFRSFHSRGFTASPGVELRVLLADHKSALRGRATAVFATENYQGYYYDVAPQFVTAARGAYKASGGYLGNRTELLYATEWDRLVMFVFGVYSNFDGARNQGSPLYKARHSFTGILGLGWLFYRSDSMEGSAL